MPGPFTCTRPPRGWRCTKTVGHPGPCPAWPTLAERVRLALRHRDPGYLFVTAGRPAVVIHRPIPKPHPNCRNTRKDP